MFMSLEDATAKLRLAVTYAEDGAWYTAYVLSKEATDIFHKEVKRRQAEGLLPKRLAGLQGLRDAPKKGTTKTK